MDCKAIDVGNINVMPDINLDYSVDGKSKIKSNEKKGDRRKVVILKVIIMLVLFIAGGIFGVTYYLKITKVTPKKIETTYELGKVKISRNPADYIDTSDYMLKKARVDISDVDKNEVGVYTIVCTVGKKEYKYKIHIEDTTKPRLHIGEIDKAFGTYNSYSINDFNINVSDISELNAVEIVACKRGDEEYEIDKDNFCLDEPGIYTFGFEVSDVYGNATYEEKEIEVFEAPHFVLLNDRFYKVGCEYEPLDFVYASDRDGNDISANIKVVNDNNYDGSVEGKYDITYAVADADDITREATITITVGDYAYNDYGFALDRQSLEILIDHDYFTYEPLTENDANDFDKVVALTSPTSFGVKNYNSPQGSYCFFSCSIYKISPDYIYFLTNKHCTTNYANTIFCDFNDNRIEVKTSDIIKTNCDLSKYRDADIQMLAVPIEYFSPENLLSYKQIYIDWDVYDKTNLNDAVVVNTQSWGYIDRANSDIIKTSNIYSILEPDESTLKAYHVPMLIFTTQFLRGGQSGSPLFDKYGNFVGIAQGYYKNKSTGVLLTDVHKFIDTMSF